MSDGTSMFRCNMVGTSSTNYITTGTTVNGQPGASFINGDANYFEVESLHAVDSPVNETTGFGMSVLDYGVISADRYYRQLWLTPPVYKGFMSKPPQQLYMRASGATGGGNPYVELQNASTQCLNIDNDSVWIRHSTGGIGLSAPHVGVGTGGTNWTWGWTGTIPIVTNIENRSGGGINWWESTINVTNGMITSAPR